MLDDFGSAEALMANTALAPAQVRLAVAYRDANRDEINEAVAENRRPLANIGVLFPFIETPSA